MPIYVFRGYDKLGKSAAGRFLADNYANAQHLLKQRGIFVSSLTLPRPGLLDNFKRQSNLAPITNELASLLSAGVLIDEALKTVCEKQSSYWKAELIFLRERLAQGSSLAKAMRERNYVFPQYYCSMIAVAEASGSLPRVFSDLSEYLNRETALKEKIRTAMIYPMIMAFVGILVVSFILAFVVPKLSLLFVASGTSLPLATKALIFVSEIIKNYWMLIWGVVIAAGYFLRFYKKAHQLKFDALLTRLGSKFIMNLYLARFASLLAILLESGIPLVSAMELAGASSGNSYFVSKIKVACEKLSQGFSFSLAMKEFPASFLQVAAAAEKSGQLALGMRNCSKIYEEDFRRQSERFMALLEPAMILIIGLVVVFIAMAVMLPLLQINEVLTK